MIRDETTTVNRLPEFTQLDIELSFTKPEFIIKLIENVLSNSWPKDFPQIPKTFERMTYGHIWFRQTRYQTQGVSGKKKINDI